MPRLAHDIHINNRIATRNGVSDLSLYSSEEVNAEDFYRALQSSYPKFFKMDLLCKWAWLGAEYLLKTDDGFVYDGMDKNKIGVVLFTSNGCLEVDKRYQETMATIPSPALFVYTLPNIMLGEICIRHGFKGEQLCMAQDGFDARELEFWVKDLLEKRNMDACLCGWADATQEHRDICMFWVTKNNVKPPFTIEAMSKVYYG